MQTVISGHHYHVSGATHKHIESEVARIEKFYNPVHDCHVTITKEDPSFRVDIIVNVHGQTLKSSSDGHKLFPVIDAAVKKMIRQLKKRHDPQSKPRVNVGVIEEGV